MSYNVRGHRVSTKRRVMNQRIRGTTLVPPPCSRDKGKNENNSGGDSIISLFKGVPLGCSFVNCLPSHIQRMSSHACRIACVKFPNALSPFEGSIGRCCQYVSPVMDSEIVQLNGCADIKKNIFFQNRAEQIIKINCDYKI